MCWNVSLPAGGGGRESDIYQSQHIKHGGYSPARIPRATDRYRAELLLISADSRGAKVSKLQPPGDPCVCTSTLYARTRVCVRVLITLLYQCPGQPP